MNLHVVQVQYGLELLRDSRILNLYNPSNMSSDGFSSLMIEFRPILNRIPEYHHFEEQL